MESEIFSPPRDLVKCCDCACPTCSLIGKPSSTWFRSVKRKYDEFETGDRFYVPGFDLYSNPKVQIENECAALRETVCSQQEKIQDLHAELEKERNASSSAATEAMSMILKLEKQKAEIQMEASQFKRFAEEKMAHDQEEIQVLEDLLYKKDQSVQSLTCEALAYKHRMMSYGLTEAEAEGDKDGEIRNLGMAEDFDAQVDLPEYDYPQLKCNMNENPGDDAEDVEKYAFGETPHARDQLRNLEQRIFQVERSSGGSQLDGGCSGTKHVFEKVIVGHSPRRTRHSRVPVWIITKQCWLANAIRQGPSTEAVAMHFKHAGVKSSHVQMKTIIVEVYVYCGSPRVYFRFLYASYSSNEVFIVFKIKQC
ncbi:hypothetical protein GOBAR_AA35647 [Gossypium barbadense]|uniref:GTD-binding domain-containing protein n=1 Tax=Gossypium barbadense TaxID=3634 RepID=A0A2P5W1V5_GOSBA|nr:hypothetical protein GOBAR_AA35647 [Gossypium barbadense]